MCNSDNIFRIELKGNFDIFTLVDGMQIFHTTEKQFFFQIFLGDKKNYFLPNIKKSLFISMVTMNDIMV